MAAIVIAVSLDRIECIADSSVLVLFNRHPPIVVFYRPVPGNSKAVQALGGNIITPSGKQRNSGSLILNNDLLKFLIFLHAFLMVQNKPCVSDTIDNFLICVIEAAEAGIFR